MTGPNASGKGEVCRFLEGLGFRVHSLSDVIREEAARQGLPPHREHLIRIGNELRGAGGAGALAERIVPRLAGRCVVDSIRQPAEVEVLRGLPSFVLVAVQAPVEVRFRRSERRSRPGDPRTLEEFVAREEQENTDDPHAQQLARTAALADRVIDNDADLPALHRRVRVLLAELGVVE